MFNLKNEQNLKQNLIRLRQVLFQKLGLEEFVWISISQVRWPLPRAGEAGWCWRGRRKSVVRTIKGVINSRIPTGGVLATELWPWTATCLPAITHLGKETTIQDRQHRCSCVIMWCVWARACVCECVCLACGHLTLQDTVKANEDSHQRMRSRETEAKVLFFCAHGQKPHSVVENTEDREKGQCV